MDDMEASGVPPRFYFANTICMLPPMVIYQFKGLYRGWFDAGEDYGDRTAIFASGIHPFYPGAVLITTTSSKQGTEKAGFSEAGV